VFPQFRRNDLSRRNPTSPKARLTTDTPAHRCGQTAFSKQVVHHPKAAHERDIIPNLRHLIGRTQYMNYMSIQHWAATVNGRPNYSGIARSLTTQNGESTPGSIRTTSADAVRESGFTPGK